jgi:hypothetical protein
MQIPPQKPSQAPPYLGSQAPNLSQSWLILKPDSSATETNMIGQTLKKRKRQQRFNKREKG